MHIERKLKEINTQLTQTMSYILSQAIATEEYSGTQISCTFNIVELDCDIIQALVNCASVALLNSTVKCKFLPAATCILLQNFDESNASDDSNLSWVLDPSTK